MTSEFACFLVLLTDDAGALRDWPAHEQVTQTNLTLVVRLPSEASPHAVLRYRYVSNNVDEIDPPNNTQAIFYQCVDIAISSSDTSEAKPVAAASLSGRTSRRVSRRVSAAAKGCCAPTQFQCTGVEHTASGVTIQHTLYWDAINLLVRWDKLGSVRTLLSLTSFVCRRLSDPHLQDGSYLSLYNNYTSNNEYVWDRTANKCSLYGSDAFYYWCFGSRVGNGQYMSYTGTQSAPGGGGTADVYTAASNGFLFGALQSSCYPAFVKLVDSTIVFGNHSALTAGPAVFVPPAPCHKPDVPMRGCRRARAAR